MTWRLPAPVGVREVENDWILAPDGVRLAISLWLPDTPAPAPVVLESIPYRKRDSTAAYSRWWGRQLARSGVGYARLDVRGSGDSGALLTDEYLPSEQADNAVAIAWLAAQPWCNGAVGMRGVSWGGFSTLQAAALNPPALKAIMSFCASDRRFTDDAHFIGGAFALTGLKWAASFKLVMAGPPDPDVFGPDWQAEWRQRLEAAPPIAARWVSHQREDAYWRQGSVGFDPAAIHCPTYLVGGWADPYNATIPRLMETLQVPAKALIGPWGHGYPAPASPGPGLDWAVEEVRWWRHWLLGEPTGIMDEPRVRAFLPEASPTQVVGDIPGRWIAEASWPPKTELLVLPLAPGRLGETSDILVELRSDASVGLQTPEWCPFSPPQLPQDQSPDDARSLVFDTEPFGEPLDLLGVPCLRLALASSAPAPKLAARLTEVDGQGRSWLITYGVLNLTHRDSHDQPAPLTPGQAYEIELPLYVAARRLPAGSRLRLALSESLWPLMWPSPEPATLTLDLAGATLRLPVRPGAGEEPGFDVPLVSAPAGEGRGPTMIREASDGWLRFRETSPQTRGALDFGTQISRWGPDVTAEMLPEDPTSCRWRVSQGVRYQRGEAWDCALESEVELTADAATFHVRERLSARQAGEVVFEREDVTDVPRDLM